MSTPVRRLAVIPARGGSKGIPGKNILAVHGKPLIAWSIEAALAAASIDHVVVSTDSDEIATVARGCGADVLKRPAELATDEATTIAVMGHVAACFADTQVFVVLQPTSPLRAPGLIDECLQIFENDGHDNLATGFYCKYREFGSHNNARRQDSQGFFYDDGNVYVLTRKLVEQGRWFGDNIARHVIARPMNYEIDDAVDLVILDALLDHYAGNTFKGDLQA